MSKFIEKLWNGEIDVMESFGKNDTRFKRIEREALDSFEKLESCLDEKQKSVYEKCFDSALNYINETVKRSFKDGFAIGTRLTAEALIGSEETLRGKD